MASRGESVPACGIRRTNRERISPAGLSGSLYSAGNDFRHTDRWSAENPYDLTRRPSIVGYRENVARRLTKRRTYGVASGAARDYYEGGLLLRTT